MNKPSIFISCGQFTEPEKRLGKQIAALVRDITGLEPFFAEEVHDLHGLDTNILGALRGCDAFITVMHPRGEITRPDGTVLTRASIWIEQEIAVAAYIQRVENRPLRIIAFKHKSVSREGLRDLLHLNPIEFESEDEVLAKLPVLLKDWKTLKPRGEIQLQLTSANVGMQEGHMISSLGLALINDAPRPVLVYECEVRVPASVLRHGSSSSLFEVSRDADCRRYRFDERHYGGVGSRDRRDLFSTSYCTKCAADHEGEEVTASREVSATAWIDGNEYEVRKTMKQLAAER